VGAAGWKWGVEERWASGAESQSSMFRAARIFTYRQIDASPQLAAGRPGGSAAFPYLYMTLRKFVWFFFLAGVEQS
jgi:hypothetical protein